MASLTITIDDDILQRARIRALQEGTSVNALLREYLEAYAGRRDAQRQAIADVRAIAERATSRRSERRWTRDELHER